MSAESLRDSCAPGGTCGAGGEHGVRSVRTARTVRTAREAPVQGPFRDRVQAGRELGRAVRALGLRSPVVLALARGGVPVGVQVAAALDAPLDVLLVRKIGAPGQGELAVAALAEARAPAQAAHLAVEPLTLRASAASMDYVRAEQRVQEREIERRRTLYLAGRERAPLAGACVVLVDDGVATGCTARAAIASLRAAAVARIVLAVPVAPAPVLADLGPLVDELVCLRRPEPFVAVGAHYRDFSQVDDEQVRRWLQAAPPWRPAAQATASAPPLA